MAKCPFIGNSIYSLEYPTPCISHSQLLVLHLVRSACTWLYTHFPTNVQHIIVQQNFCTWIRGKRIHEKPTTKYFKLATTPRHTIGRNRNLGKVCGTPPPGRSAQVISHITITANERNYIGCICWTSASLRLASSTGSMLSSLQKQGNEWWGYAQRWEVMVSIMVKSTTVIHLQTMSWAANISRVTYACCISVKDRTFFKAVS